MNCPHCNATMEPGARFCGLCGSEISADTGEVHRAGPPSYEGTGRPAQAADEESIAFAVVTLLAWIFFWPVGLVLNVIGLVSGPRKGCFWWMFIVFFLAPGILAVLLIVLFFVLGVGMAVTA